MTDKHLTGEKALSDRCCDIYNIVFGNIFSHDVFRYKHYENPYRLATPLYIRNIGGDIAGINGFLAAKFICQSQEGYAAQSCDSAVLKQYRGRGVFTSIIKEAQTQLQFAGVDFLFGFPNSNSYPGFIKLGWKHEADFCRFFLPIDWYSLLHKRIGRTCARIFHPFLSKIKLYRINRLATKPLNCTINSYACCPFTEEDYAMINNCGQIMAKRSIEYYTFKLDANPTKNFEYIVARDGNRLLGFIVYYVYNNELNIVDWFCSSHNNKLVILAKIIKQMFGKINKINVLMVNTSSEEAQMMKRLGFWNSANRIFRRPKSPLITYTLNKTIETKLHMPEKWFIRYIDSDTIIS